MTPLKFILAFLPELALLGGALALFVATLGHSRSALARNLAMLTALATTAAAAFCLGEQATLFSGAYRVDLFSQVLKLAFGLGFVVILVINAGLPDIRDDVKPEYFLFLTISVLGLTMLVSSVDLITLVVALETSSYPLYFLVPMRREREGQRVQMEAAIKYLMFGVAANGIMFFGMSYLVGLGGSTSLPVLMQKLAPAINSPLVIAGLALTFCGLFYKLAVFPFHFWTPDVYEGASNETASLIASLPKIGAVAVLIRIVSLASPNNHAIAVLLTSLAAISMLYGNLIALQQRDLKRLLGFSGIAHAGYALVGFVALDNDGFRAALYYIIGYLFMVLACFVVICQLSRDGRNVSLEDLAGLQRRSPLLTLTLLVGVFALASVPPFVGFMAKFALLKAALAKGHLALVIVAVVNTAIAVYYYLSIVREACTREPGNHPDIVLSWPTRAICLVLIAAILALGVVPGTILEVLGSSLLALR